MITIWLARDKDNELNGYERKPFRQEEYFVHCGGKVYFIDDNLFPEVTWKNSPQQAEFKLTSNTISNVKERLKMIKDLKPEFAQVIEEHFWDLLS